MGGLPVDVLYEKQFHIAFLGISEPIMRNICFIKYHFCKVQLFREGHRNLRNIPQGLDIYLVKFQTLRMIAQISVAFSEKLNFTA